MRTASQPAKNRMSDRELTRIGFMSLSLFKRYFSPLPVLLLLCYYFEVARLILAIAALYSAALRSVRLRKQFKIRIKIHLTVKYSSEVGNSFLAAPCLSLILLLLLLLWRGQANDEICICGGEFPIKLSNNDKHPNHVSHQVYYSL